MRSTAGGLPPEFIQSHIVVRDCPNARAGINQKTRGVLVFVLCFCACKIYRQPDSNSCLSLCKCTSFFFYSLSWWRICAWLEYHFLDDEFIRVKTKKWRKLLREIVSFVCVCVRILWYIKLVSLYIKSRQETNSDTLGSHCWATLINVYVHHLCIVRSNMCVYYSHTFFLRVCSRQCVGFTFFVFFPFSLWSRLLICGHCFLVCKAGIGVALLMSLCICVYSCFK